MTPKELATCVQMLGAYWPHASKEWTPEVIESWEMLLGDLDAKAVAATIGAIAAEGDRFPPPPGLLRRRTLELVSDFPSPDDAWAEVLHWIGRLGRSRGQVRDAQGHIAQCEWSHPVIGRVVENMGWAKLCDSDNQVTDRAHFIRFYAAAVEHERTAAHMPPFAKNLLEAVKAKGLALPDMSAAKALTP